MFFAVARNQIEQHGIWHAKYTITTATMRTLSLSTMRSRVCFLIQTGGQVALASLRTKKMLQNLIALAPAPVSPLLFPGADLWVP